MKYIIKGIPQTSYLILGLALLTFMVQSIVTYKDHNLVNTLSLFIQDSWMQILLFVVIYIFGVSYIVNQFENSSLILRYQSKEKIFYKRCQVIMLYLIGIQVLYFGLSILLTYVTNGQFTLGEALIESVYDKPYNFHMGSWLIVQFIINTLILIAQTSVALIFIDITKNSKFSVGISALLFFVLQQVCFSDFRFIALMGLQYDIRISISSYVYGIVFWSSIIPMIAIINLLVFRHTKDFGMIEEFLG